jgi:hypothetical protein
MCYLRDGMLAKQRARKATDTHGNSVLNTAKRAKMFRVGIVKAQDAVNARVRVIFPDRDQMESWWLPVVVAKTQMTRCTGCRI